MIVVKVAKLLMIRSTNNKNNKRKENTRTHKAVFLYLKTISDFYVKNEQVAVFYNTITDVCFIQCLDFSKLDTDQY
jgi:hypothetical protein